MSKTGAEVRDIESSLDRGVVGLSTIDLAQPDLTKKVLTPPKIDKTPYTA